MGISQIELRLHNFKSYIDSGWIKLNEKIEIIGENRIDGGSNGSGKSSILEALWVLVQQSKNVIKPSELKKYDRNSAHDFSIDAKVTYDEKAYAIHSTRQGLQCDNAVKKGLADLCYSFLLQGMPNSFANLKPADRKNAISIDFDCDNLVERSINNLEIGMEKVEAKWRATKERSETEKEKLGGLEKSLYSKRSELNQVRDRLSSIPAIPSILDIGNLNLHQLRDEKDNIENEIHNLTTARAELSGDLGPKKSNLIKEKDEIIKKANNDYNLRVGSFISNKVKSVTK